MCAIINGRAQYMKIVKNVLNYFLSSHLTRQNKLFDAILQIDLKFIYANY